MKFFDILLKIFTFGLTRSFMVDTTTTIGLTIYIGSTWDSRSPGQKIGTIKHEAVHLRQQKKYGKFIFLFLYIFPYFPIGFARWRVKFEQEGYEESMRSLAADIGAQYLFDKNYKASICDHFVKSSYFWMWYKRSDIEAWYDETRSKILDEHIAQ
jgi:hypothetical protein